CPLGCEHIGELCHINRWEPCAVLRYGRMVSGPPAIINLKGDQLTQEGGALRLRCIAQVVLDARPLPRGLRGFPGCLESVADPVRALHRRWRQRLLARVRLVAHEAISCRRLKALGTA